MEVEPDENCALHVRTKAVKRADVKAATYYGWVIDHLSYTTDPVWIHLSEKRNYMNFLTDYVGYIYWNYIGNWCWSGGAPVWTTDACQTNLAKYWGNDNVQYVSTGNYHWNPGCAQCPPTLYVHSLVNQEIGYLNANYYCQSWVSGSYVWGFGQTCQRI